MARGGGTMPSDDEGGGAAAAPAHERKVGLMGMIVMGFFWGVGGMYGNEELLQAGRRCTC